MLADYLALRHAVGFALAGQDRLLGEFVGGLEAAGEERITTRAALAWASAARSRRSQAARLQMVRVFARYAQAVDPATEVPSTKLIPPSKGRPAPYLYSEDEVLALMAAARELRPELWGATCATVVGLLWATGLRPGEASRLAPADVSFGDAVLTVWRSKRQKSRHVPLSTSTVDALADYDAMRRRLHASPTSFFVNRNGAPIGPNALDGEFGRLLARAGVPRRQTPRRPRLGDLRHSFATRTLLGWHRDGLDVQAMLPRLSTVLGHVGPASTYWYLSAAPELLALVAERLDHRDEAAS